MPLSIHELHTALWSSFLASADVAGFPPGRMPMSTGNTLSVLLSLLTPENVDTLGRVPRPLLGIATWNLLPQYLGKPDAPKLEPLLRHVIGMTLDEVEAIYSQSKDPLLVLARQYNILDYRWELIPEQEPSKEVEAKLQICVQNDLRALKHIVFPDHWPKYEWLWGPVKLVAGRNEPRWVKHETGEEKLTGRVKLPGGPKAAETAVYLDVAFHSTPLDVTNQFSIKGEMFKSCSGSFTIEKMRGRPGATRITHTKKAEFSAVVPEKTRRDVLRYWLQTETLRLALPG